MLEELQGKPRESFEHKGNAVLRTGFMRKRPAFGATVKEIRVRYVKFEFIDGVQIQYIQTRNRRRELKYVKHDSLSFAELLIDNQSAWDSRDTLPVVATLEELNAFYPSELA